MTTFLNRIIFFLGWLLSPFTFWNDAFVNIPISYIAANLVFRAVHIKFMTLVLIFYWLSNGLGILLMYLTGRKLMGRGRRGKELINVVVAIIAYSLLLLLLNKFGILKPI
ncbi:MAG: hypothetical protein WC738_03700 [Candidatus Omnitrophota bacterium]|jgi:hypothetical protein